MATNSSPDTTSIPTVQVNGLSITADQGNKDSVVIPPGARLATNQEVDIPASQRASKGIYYEPGQNAWFVQDGAINTSPNTASGYYGLITQPPPALKALTPVDIPEPGTSTVTSVNLINNQINQQSTPVNDPQAQTADTTAANVSNNDITRYQAKPPTVGSDAQSNADGFVTQTNQDIIGAITPQKTQSDIGENAGAGSAKVTPQVPKAESAMNVASNNTAGSVDQARTQGPTNVQSNDQQQNDWRIRLQLAKDANDYLYNIAKEGDVLYPLKATNGVIFPYTPQIQLGYRANYDVVDLVHNNYKQYFYRNSSVEDINILCTFTAQDTFEADYILAVMHFFRSVTKMFYGQDGNNGPRAGTPPPLCFLTGLGQYQFTNHPLLISSFSFTLPDDVDYIRSGSTTQFAGVNLGAYTPKPQAKKGIQAYLPGLDRLLGSKLNKGGIAAEPAFQYLSNSQATYIPTKIQFQISAYPIVTRSNTTNVFSLEKYATGELLKKGFW